MPPQQKSRQAARTRKLRRLTLIACSASAAVVLTACTSSTPQSSGHTDKPSLKPTGAVNPAQAKAIVDRYEVVNNQANKTRSPKLLSTVEGGQLYLQSRAGFEQWRTMSAKEQRESTLPFFYRKRTYYIPVAATWFAVKATSSNGYPRLLIFDRYKGSPWKNVAALTLKTPLPAIDTSRSGLATAVEPSRKTAAGLAPGEVRGAYEDLFTTGGEKSGTALSRETETAKSAIKIHQERNQGKNSKYFRTDYTEVKPEHREVYALKLRDGGVLALSSTAHEAMRAIKENFVYRIKAVPTKEEAVYNKDERIAIVNTYEGLVLAHLPVSGKTSLLARAYAMVDSQ